MKLYHAESSPVMLSSTLPAAAIQLHVFLLSPLQKEPRGLRLLNQQQAC